MDAILDLPQKHPLLLIQEEENEIKRRKRRPLFSDLNDGQLMAIFGESLRFELCRVVLTSDFFADADHKLFGTIQAAAAGAGGFLSSDPLLRSSSDIFIFNREFNNPVHIPGDTQTLHDVCYCSLPVSSTSVVQIAAKLYVTTDKIDDVEEYLPDDYIPEPLELEPVTSPKTLESFEELVREWDEYMGPARAATQEQIANNASLDNEVEPIPDDYKYVIIDHEAFHVCDDRTLINISDKPNGGAGCSILRGLNGCLHLYYVVFKYAVDAELEVEFITRPTAAYTEVTGSIWVYYGKGFDYDKHADNYRVGLLDPDSYVTPGRVNLYRSVLAVPANSSLIIKANLSKGGVDLLSGSLEFHVPLDFRSSSATIKADGYSLKLRVNWKLPSEELKIRSSSNSSVSCLAERRKFGAHYTVTMADPDKRNRWSLQQEIAKVFNTSLKRTYNLQEDVPCSISTCTKEDGGDYLCSTVMHIWPDIKSTPLYEGPKHAGVIVKDNIMGSEYKDMMERCVVCGPGFVKFKLCRKWIAKSIHTMLTVGIKIWAPKLPVKKAVLFLTQPYMTVEMHMDHVRSKFIGQTLGRILEYSGAVAPQLGIFDLGFLDPSIESFYHMFIDHIDLAVEQVVGELKGRDQRQHMDYVKKKSESFYESYIREIVVLAREKGLHIGSEEDELLLRHLLVLGHALKERMADWIVYVSNVGKRVYIEICITAAERAGLIANDDPKCPLSHVGLGLVQGDDFERFRTSSTKVNLYNLLCEAKSRCKVLLARQAGITDEWTPNKLENAAKALGYGALRYADLKNNRLTNYTFSFDQMLNEEGNTAVYLQFTYVRICSITKNSSKYIKELTAEALILKHDNERELGLHLLRFTEVLREVCTMVTPHILCDYLYGLCKKLNSLDSGVWQAVGSSEETSKLLLCKATEKVMKKCFYLLGITPINENLE